MRNGITTLLEICGFVLLVLAGFEIHDALGYAIAGASSISIGYLTGRG